MSILPKIMAEKRARMEAEEGLGEEGPRPMKTRRRTYMETQGIETEERPGAQSAPGTGENLATAEGHLEEVIEVKMPNNMTGTKDVRRTSPINLMNSVLKRQTP